MQLVNPVSAFQIYQNLSDVTAKKPKPASENSEPIKNEQLGLSDCVSVTLIMPNAESECVHRVVCYTH